MDPNTGRLYTPEEMAALDEKHKAQLVELKASVKDAERISLAVAELAEKERSSKYQQIRFPVGTTNGGFRSQVVDLDCCNLCGAVVGNRPAHDVFCYSDDGPIPENYR